MEIITKEENGVLKDYLVTNLGKFDNHTIDANELFLDVKALIKTILNKSNAKFGTKNAYIKEGYGAPLQSLWSRYSGDYFSPSFMAGYTKNPALNLAENFFTEGINDATALGTTFHKILEEYYKLPPEERNRLKLFDLMEEYTPENQDKEKIREYVEGYIKIKDYLHPRSELDDTKLECITEHRGRAQNLYVRSIGYTVPCAVSYVADRIDFRDGEAIILDYKTGKFRPEAVTFNGYLGSMILYKWAMEQEQNIEISKGYLIYPGEKTKYHQLDYSIENEKLLSEKINAFYKDFITDVRNRTYKFTDDGYFTTEASKAFREIMTDNTKWFCKIPVEFYIGQHEDSVL